MNLAWAIAGALSGLLAGWALRGQVFRLSVPSGSPERTACPGCGTKVASSRLVARCVQCRDWLGKPVVLEVATGAVVGLLLGRFDGQPVAAAFCVFGALGVALAAIDISVKRLPDRLTLPAYPLLIALLAIAALASHQGAALVRSLLAGLVLGGAYLLLALIRPGQLGGGDIKLAGLAGLTLGWLGWPVVVLGGALGFVLCALVSVLLLATRRITLSSSICFGPFLLSGAILALVAVG